MSLIRIEKVSKSFAGDLVLDEIDFRVEDDEKIGLIGRNGSGKSTLFRLITGETEADSGVMERMRRARIACLAQIPDVDAHRSLHDIAMEPFRDLMELEKKLGELEERLANGDELVLNEYSTVQDDFSIRGGYEYRANADRVLTGLGFSKDEFSLPFTALSGGQRTRLMLALVLLQDADLLLLDEPENHLDLQAREWLEGFLKDWPRAFVIISHDRHMLNAVTERTAEVERGEIFAFSGNYDAFQKEKLRIREDQHRAYQKQQEFVQREESWINRFRYKSTKAKQVQSRIKRLEKLERIEEPLQDKSSVKFGLGEVVRSGQIVMEADGLTMGYPGLPLYSDVSFTVARGERVGIVGPNGSGKSTLLKHIAGLIEGQAGEVKLGHKVAIGNYDQHHEGANTANDILKEIMSVRPDMSPQEVRSFMGRFLFSGDDVFKAMNTLSGGERSRVAVAKLILSKANLLLLDEPTNHLDIASRVALEEAFVSFPGSMVIVSHDRALIDTLVDKLVIVDGGKATVYLGNYSDYRWRESKSGGREEERAAEEAMRIRRNKKKEGSKNSKALNSKKRVKRFKILETEIHRIEAEVEEFEGQFGGVDPADHERLQELNEKYKTSKETLGELYIEWEALGEQLAP